MNSLKEDLKRLVSLAQDHNVLLDRQTAVLRDISQSLKHGDLVQEIHDLRSDFRPELKQSHAVRLRKQSKQELSECIRTAMQEASTLTN